MPLETLRHNARDGYPLAVDVHVPTGTPRATVVLAPAMAVPRRFYRPFASWLSDNGLLVAVPDYRGIGDSAPDRLRGFPATLEDWAHQDLASILDLVAQRAPDVPRRWFGHSVGGQLFGLLEDVRGVDRAVFVASQSGFWRNWTGRPRYAMAALWHLGIPALVPTFGYLPMKRLGQGLDVPAGVARQWARWGRQPTYIRTAASPESAFDRYDGSIRAIAITDDSYAPPSTVDALTALYRRADVTRTDLSPRDLSADRVGHFAIFRPDFRERAWPTLLHALADGLPATG